MVHVRLTSTLLLFSFILFLNTACNKSDKDNDPGGQPGTEKPGHIPGFGEEPGYPTGTQFVLPAGISLKGEIIGSDDGPSSSDCVSDGQGNWVIVRLKLQNDSTVGPPIIVEFPPGLVIVSASEGFQSGLLVEEVVVAVPPKDANGGGGECQVSLLLSCTNKERNPSDPTAKYKLGPVTNSPLIRDFMQKLSGKRIKYSEYLAVNDIDYVYNQEKTQHALWHITDGEGLTESDLENIASLPDK